MAQDFLASVTCISYERYHHRLSEAYFRDRLAAEPGAAGDLAKAVEYWANTIEQLRVN